MHSILQMPADDNDEPASVGCSTGDLLDDHRRREEEHEGHTIGSHRRLLPGVFGRGAIPFRVGYPGRIGRAGGRGGVGRGGPGGNFEEVEEA